MQPNSPSPNKKACLEKAGPITQIVSSFIPEKIKSFTARNLASIYVTELIGSYEEAP